MRNSLLILALITVIVASRLTPHPANFVPLTGLILLTSKYFSTKISLAITILSMFISDYLLGFHDTMLWVYSSLVVIALSSSLLKRYLNFSSVWLYAFFSALIFYLVTNFGVWYSTDMYSKTLDGLINCYIMALPFFRNSLTGDLFYSFVVFGLVDLYCVLKTKHIKAILLEC